MVGAFVFKEKPIISSKQELNQKPDCQQDQWHDEVVIQLPKLRVLQLELNFFRLLVQQRHFLILYLHLALALGFQLDQRLNHLLLYLEQLGHGALEQLLLVVLINRQLVELAEDGPVGQVA